MRLWLLVAIKAVLRSLSKVVRFPSSRQRGGVRVARRRVRPFSERNIPLSEPRPMRVELGLLLVGDAEGEGHEFAPRAFFDPSADPIFLAVDHAVAAIIRMYGLRLPIVLEDGAVAVVSHRFR